jgi:hypothetical protein
VVVAFSREDAGIPLNGLRETAKTSIRISDVPAVVTARPTCSVEYHDKIFLIQLKEYQYPNLESA